MLESLLRQTRRKVFPHRLQIAAIGEGDEWPILVEHVDEIGLRGAVPFLGETLVGAGLLARIVETGGS